VRFVFFVIRFAFYCFAVAAYTCFVGGLGLAVGIAWVALLPFYWAIFGIPFMFVMAAFKNDPRVLTEFIRRSVAKWKLNIIAALRAFFGVYRAMTEWLIRGYG
jgi:hypothetical protein